MVANSLCLCCNLNIGFMTKCEMQRPMRPKMCLGLKCTLTNVGECNIWSPMTPNCTLTLGIMNVQSLGWKGKQVPNWTQGHH
jgi:hypothetical protein